MSVNQHHAYNNPQPELTLEGCGFNINQNRVLITIGQISSHRSSGDLSGTLAIELWALKSPYQNGQPDGELVAATSIGELAGQHFIADCSYDLIFQEPPAGTWHMSLLLREWTAEGYISRDYVNFSIPYVAPVNSSTKRSEANNLIKLDFSAPKKSPTKTVASDSAKPAAQDEKSYVSLNQAELNELEQVKGVSKKLAENIIATRPFNTLEEVLKVKGMGAKLLQKIRDYITL
jgi:competence ComEA-like helix-hairpin-helix protein